MPNQGLYSQGGTSVPYDRQGELYLQGLTRHIESRTITYSDFSVQSLSLTPMDYPANASQRETDYSTSSIMSSYSGLSVHASCTRLGQATSVASHGDLASQSQIVFLYLNCLVQVLKEIKIYILNTLEKCWWRMGISKSMFVSLSSS